jgi:hypothetical protein
MHPLNKMGVVTERSWFSFKRFGLVLFYIIWHIVVESDFHIHHKYSEDVGTAKFHMIQFFLCIDVTARRQDVRLLTPLTIQITFFAV